MYVSSSVCTQKNTLLETTEENRAGVCSYFLCTGGVSEVFRKNKKGVVIIPDDNIT
jgi:hypothetical protein